MGIVNVCARFGGILAPLLLLLVSVHYCICHRITIVLKIICHIIMEMFVV